MITLAPNEEAMARRIAALIISSRQAILTREEAKAHTKHFSDTAFDRWCAKYRVRPCDRGRYARGQLDRALLKEATPRAGHRQPRQRQPIAA